MTEKQAFKVGFLKKFAELGYTPDQLPGVFEKSAWMGDLLKTLTVAGIGLPLAGGALVGGMVGGVTSPSEEDLEDIKRRELIAAYKRTTREIRRRMEQKARREA